LVFEVSVKRLEEKASFFPAYTQVRVHPSFRIFDAPFFYLLLIFGIKGSSLDEEQFRFSCPLFLEI